MGGDDVARELGIVSVAALPTTDHNGILRTYMWHSLHTHSSVVGL